MKYTNEEIENIVYENQLHREIIKNLRSPLNSISGYVMRLMKNSENPAKVLEYAHNIGLSCQDMLVMFNQTEELSGEVRLDRTKASYGEIALGQVINDATDVARSWMRYKYLQLEIDIRGVEDDLFIGDRVLITETLRNLLSNAVQTTPEGGTVTLAVTGKCDVEPGYCNIAFSVSDNGPGLSAEVLKRFFENAGNESAQSGAVIGRIPMVQRFVNMMGGTISVQSTPGQGTTYTVVLHLKTVDRQRDVFWKEHGVRRALVVCEDLREAERVCKLLGSTGLDAEYTSSGYSALQIVEQANMQEKCFDLILLDRDIHDQSYTEFTRQLRGISFIRRPVVVLLSNKPEHFTSEVHKSGIAKIMPKPFFFSTLKDIVKELDLDAEKTGTGTTPVNVNHLLGRRFLVAEDSTVHANVIRELLEVEGARSEIAGNGKAAVAMFRNAKPGYYDAILMDVRMPVADGYAAALEIRGLTRSDAASVPIIAMIADPSEIDEERAATGSITAHCTKPPDVQEIRQILTATV